MPRPRKTGITGQWPGAVPVTNKNTVGSPKKARAPPATQKKARPESSQPSTPISRKTGGNRSQGGGRTQDDDDEDENISPVRSKSKKRPAKVVLSDEEGEDEPEVPSSDTLHSSDVAPPKKPRSKKARGSAVPQHRAAGVQNIDDDAPWLIRHAKYLNINDEDADRKSNGVYDFYDRCTNAYRTCGPFVNLEVAYFRGAEFHADKDFSPHAGDEKLDEDTYHWHIHSVLGSLLSPELPDAEKQFGNYPDAAVKILQYIDAAAARGRSNDMGRLRDRILGYAGIKTTKEVARLTPRAARGWNNTTLGRLLCPMNKLGEFDDDPEAFCQKVLEDKDGYRFGALRWPSFLYDEETHVKGKMRTGLFRSRFFLLCFLLIFCGPSAAGDEYETGAQSQGTPPLVQRHHIKTITGEHLVYVACLVRFLLSSAPRWKERDGPWVGKDFADSLLHLFYRNTAFMNETLNWYDKKIFGNRFDDDDDGSDCEAAMLLAEEEQEREEREARRIAKAKRVRTPAPEAEAEEQDGATSDNNNDDNETTS